MMTGLVIGSLSEWVMGSRCYSGMTYGCGHNLLVGRLQDYSWYLVYMRVVLQILVAGWMGGGVGESRGVIGYL